VSAKSDEGHNDDDNSSVIENDDDDEEVTVLVSANSAIRSPASFSEDPATNRALQPMGPSKAKAILERFATNCKIDEERMCVSVLAELLSTEKTYVSDLRSLIKEYVIPLRRATKRKKCKDLDSASIMCEHGSLRSSCNKQSTESGPLLSADDVRTVFMNVETLVKVNAVLLKAIEDGISAFGENEVDEISDGLASLVDIFSSNFEKIKPFFTMYALYCHQYPIACERLQKVRADDEEADTFLRERESKSTQTSLRSLLIKPVQRICRYPLLFQELLKRVKAVENVYPDRKKGTIHLLVEVIESTAENVQKIANDVNQKVHVQETIGSILNVFHELGGAAEGGNDQIKTQLLAPSRRFVRSEDVFFREAPFDTEVEPRKLYLFNDLIILAVEKDGGNGHATMKRKSGTSRTRGKSFGTLVSGLMPNQNGNNEAASAAANAEQVPWSFQPTHWIDLGSGDVRPLPKPDDTGRYGFRMKSIKRITTDDNNNNATVDNKSGMEKKKSAKRITWGAGVKESNTVPTGSKAPTRVVTVIQKYEIWMSLRDKLQRLISDIEDKVAVLDLLQQNASKAISKYGATQQKKTRSWIQKKASKEEAMDGPPGTRKSFSGSVDARDALQTISKKYSNGGVGNQS